MKLSQLLILCASVVLASAANADMIKLKDNKTLMGKFAGGTDDIVRFQTDDNIQVINRNDVLAITFTAPGAPAPPGNVHVGSVGPMSGTSSGTATSATMTIPAGSYLIIKTNDATGAPSGGVLQVRLAEPLTIKK